MTTESYSLMNSESEVKKKSQKKLVFGAAIIFLFLAGITLSYQQYNFELSAEEDYIGCLL